jgi:NAD+ kinase
MVPLPAENVYEAEGLSAPNMRPFKTIGLISKLDDPRLKVTVTALLTQLKARGLDVLVGDSVARLLGDAALVTADRDELARRCDLVIVVGGDGTLLQTARSLAGTDALLLGVNYGRLGFLADISPDEVEQRLDQILAGDYQLELRFLLRARVLREGRSVHENVAFNDVVVHAQSLARMIEVETYIDERFLNAQRADGLIVSTPTGSTAYALSGGGPILHPCLEAIVLVPICPHTLSNRPIVISADSHIEIALTESNTTPAQASFDGQDNFDLRPGDRVAIQRHERPIRLIQPGGHNYFDTLRAKLHWSEPPR